MFSESDVTENPLLPESHQVVTSSFNHQFLHDQNVTGNSIGYGSHSIHNTSTSSLPSRRLIEFPYIPVNSNPIATSSSQSSQIASGTSGGAPSGGGDILGVINTLNSSQQRTDEPINLSQRDQNVIGYIQQQLMQEGEQLNSQATVRNIQQQLMQEGETFTSGTGQNSSHIHYQQSPSSVSTALSSVNTSLGNNSIIQSSLVSSQSRNEGNSSVIMYGHQSDYRSIAERGNLLNLSSNYTHLSEQNLITRFPAQRNQSSDATSAPNSASVRQENLPATSGSSASITNDTSHSNLSVQRNISLGDNVSPSTSQSSQAPVIDLTQPTDSESEVVDLTESAGFPLHRSRNVVDLTMEIDSSDSEATDNEEASETDSVISVGNETERAGQVDSGSLQLPSAVNVVPTAINNQATVSVKPSNPTASDVDDSEGCPICFEEWTNSGEHRLVSLKCGHLFGQSCIEKWLKGPKGKCPQCNAKAKKVDIRVIYAKSLKAIDTSERDRALKDLEQEKLVRRKTELEAAEIRLKYQIAMEEHKKLKEEFERQMQTAQTRSSKSQGNDNNAVSSVSTNYGKKLMRQNHYSLYKTVTVFEKGGCRIMTHSENFGQLLVSQPSNISLFPGYGVKKISTMDLKTAQYISIHSKVIRDMALKPHAVDGLLLSGALDKTLKMTSLITNSTVQTWEAPTPVWSVCWNADNTNYFYAGLSNGKVLLYDVRDTSQHVEEYNKNGSSSTPLVSLQYVSKDSFRCKGLLLGQLDRVSFLESVDNNEVRPHVLLNKGIVTCVNYDTNTQQILASFRPSHGAPNVRHQILKLHCTTVGDSAVSVQLVKTLHGGTTMKLMSRSLLFKPSENCVQSFVCAGDEATQSAQIWEATNGRLLHKFGHHGPMLDVCAFRINQKHFLGTLTEKQMNLYKWNDEQLEGTN